MRIINKLIANLNVISELRVGQKISALKEDLNIDQEGWTQWVIRSLHYDDKEKSIAAIVNMVETSIVITSLMLETEFTNKMTETLVSDSVNEDCVEIPVPTRQDIIKNVAEILLKSIRGLDNLIITYGDTTSKRKIDDIKKSINDFILSVGRVMTLSHQA